MKSTFDIKEYDNRKDYKFDFDKVAKVLLNCTKLRTSINTYLIREIEFYYYSQNHTDFYCHRNRRQLLSFQFYFHRFKDPDKYIRLKQKGIDITIGKDENIYGGILIRAIENIETKKIYTGIGNLTNQIIEEIGGASEIQRLYESDKDIFHPSSSICLKQSTNNGLKIFKKERQGLNLKEQDSDRFYLNSKYNYFTYPEIEPVK